MATKAATKTTTNDNVKPEAGAPEATNDSPLLDLSDAAVKKLIKVAKKRGYVTYEELNAVMPSEEVSSEQIEDIMSMFSDMGINVVDEDEVEETEVEKDEDDTGTEVAPSTGSAVATTSNTKAGSDRTDDPVRMYLREMGSVELLSREGEIAIAKRIEAGRETMIEGLCESPLTFQAIIIWREQLAQGEILLRDIIDLEATYAGPDAKQATPTPEVLSMHTHPKVEPAAAPKPVARRSTGDSDDDYVPEEPQAPQDPVADDDDDEFENALSLSAMEAELKPQVVETFDRIADAYGKMRIMQDRHAGNPTDAVSAADTKKLDVLRGEVITDVKSLSLNAGRIENLVEQLYDINKRLVKLEGRLLRLAESYGVKREKFLEILLWPGSEPGLGRIAGNPRRQGLGRIRQARSRYNPRNPRRCGDPGDRSWPQHRRVPPHRAQGAKGRARSCYRQEGNGRGQSPPRDFHRQEVHQPWVAVPRSDPGRQYRPDEGRG